MCLSHPKVAVVEKDGSPQAGKVFGIWNPGVTAPGEEDHEVDDEEVSARVQG